MKQSVCAAQVDECAEIGDILDHALNGLAYLDALEELLLHRCLLRYEKLLAVADDASSSRIELGDHELDLLSGVLA